MTINFYAPLLYTKNCMYNHYYIHYLHKLIRQHENGDHNNNKKNNFKHLDDPNDDSKQASAIRTDNRQLVFYGDLDNENLHQQNHKQNDEKGEALAEFNNNQEDAYHLNTCKDEYTSAIEYSSSSDSESEYGSNYLDATDSSDNILDRAYTEPRQKKVMYPTIAHINARSIVNKTEAANAFIKDSGANLIGVSETWQTKAKEHDTNTELIRASQNKISIASNPRADRSGGGTMLIVDNNYFDTFEHVNPGAAYSSTLEATIVRLQPYRMPRSFGTCYVVCVYIPPPLQKNGINEVSELSDALAHIIDQQKSSSKPLIYICGDFNGANISQLKNYYNVERLNHEPTRGARCLDLILTNCNTQYACRYDSPLNKDCDHLIISAQHDTEKHNQSKTRPHYTKIKKRTGSFDDVIEEIKVTDWHLIKELPEDKFQEKVDVFYGQLHAILDHFMPEKEVRICDKDKPWMTEKLKRNIIKRQALYAAKKYEEHHLLQTTIKRSIKWNKKTYYSTLMLGDSKRWWNELKDVDGQNIAQKIDYSAEALNDGFVSVWKNKTRSELIYRPEFTEFLRIEYHKVEHELSKLNCGKATGPDGISAKLLKEARHYLAPIISHIFNLSIKHSIVPTQWKEANIAPIAKVPHPKSAGDYRPIAVTSILSRSLERIIARQIMADTQKLWETNEQFGFLAGRSTFDAIALTIEDFEKAQDERNSIHVTFYDFKKAFDLVPHDGLIEKCRSLLKPWQTAWICNFLQGRTQKVKIGQEISSPKDVIAGVIQGSAIGPTAFLLYISDINKFIPESTTLRKFADDLLAFEIFKSLVDDNSQSTANGISKWAEVNDMQLNEKKTVHMIINQREPGPIKLQLNETMLELVKFYKYLGYSVTEDLDSDAQWKQIFSRIHSQVYLFKRLKRLGFKTEVMVTAMKGLTQSLFIYGAPLLTSSSEKAVNAMNSIQNRILHVIGVRNQDQVNRHNIKSTKHLIESSCNRALKKMLRDPKHPIISRLKRKERVNKSKFPFILNKARTEKYQNSLVQKHLQMLRDELENPEKEEATNHQLYTPYTQRKVNLNKKLAQETLESSKVKCLLCEKEFKNRRGLAIHTGRCHK